MSKTRIFVSSTCYDLAAVREDLRAHILSLGHEPILSEYPSFPVDPDESAITNCKKNVQKNTDILLLIVGGSRGSLDPVSRRSVTNLEYDVARQQGVPCFVFISQQVLTLLPLWQKSPKADFSPAVDYPEVFEFVARIRGENRWTFSFMKTSDIKEALTLQLSVMFRELLDRDRAGTLDSLAPYSSESAEAQRLARDKPPYWEFLLTAELLRTRTEEIRRQFERLKEGAVHVPSRLIAGREFFAWTGAKISDLKSLIEAIRLQMPAIHRAWGELGQPGDVHAIRTAVTEFGELCGQLIEWEKDLRGAKPPEATRALKRTMEGFTEGVIRELERLPRELVRPFEGGAKPTGSLEIMLTLRSPPMERFNEELDKLREGPFDWFK
jgi:hypothetical protein